MTENNPPQFYSAFSKAHWATDKIKVLDRSIRNYVENNIRVTVEQPNGPDGEKTVIIVTDKIFIPAHLMVGDIVRNLRDALDHFVSAVFRERLGTGSDKRIVFPVADNRQNLEGVVSTTFKDASVAEFGNTILNIIKPTLADDSAIWKFNQINNSDKH